MTLMVFSDVFHPQVSGLDHLPAFTRVYYERSRGYCVLVLCFILYVDIQAECV